MSDAPANSPRSTIFRRFLLGVLLLAGVLGGYVWYDMHCALNRGRQLLLQGESPAAVPEFRRYLTIHPGSDSTRLLLAQALLSSTTSTDNSGLSAALQQLALIPDDSPLASEARMRAARVELLNQLRPGRAEVLLRDAIRLDPSSHDAHYLLWKLLDMTERPEWSEPYFWKAYEQTPGQLRSLRLREWYLSQFSPVTSTTEFDIAMGLLAPDEVPSKTTVLRRLQTFRLSEQDSALATAAVACWFRQNGSPQEALTLLQEFRHYEAALTNRFFIATVILAQLDLGEFEQAHVLFDRWPEPRSGYDYSKLHGIIQDEINDDAAAAVEACNKVTEEWPGMIDWPVMLRKASCLMRLGLKDESNELRRQAKRIELLMETNIHVDLRKALADLNNPLTANKLADFYRLLNREREAMAWMALVDH
ncbi:MAG: hypothetical protein ABGZ53_34800 [Fuerstiella sp.]